MPPLSAYQIISAVRLMNVTGSGLPSGNRKVCKYPLCSQASSMAFWISHSTPVEICQYARWMPSLLSFRMSGFTGV